MLAWYVGHWIFTKVRKSGVFVRKLHLLETGLTSGMLHSVPRPRMPRLHHSKMNSIHQSPIATSCLGACRVRVPDCGAKLAYIRQS